LVSRPRFGLFSQPPYATVGDPYNDIPFNRTRRSPDRVGRAIAPEGPLRGTLTNPMKKGQTGAGVFSQPSANGIGDTYVGSRC